MPTNIHKRIFFLALLLPAVMIYAQEKPCLDNYSWKKWETLQQYNISNNGVYVWYTTNTPADGSRLIFTTADMRYKHTFRGVYRASFTRDSRYMIFISPEGTGIFQTRTHTLKYLKGLNNFQLPEAGTSKWLVASNDHSTVLYDLQADKVVKAYMKVKQALFNPQGTLLVLRSDSLLWCLDLSTGESTTLFRGNVTPHITFNHAGDRVAFIGEQQGIYTIYHYRKGDSGPSLLVHNNVPEITQPLIIAPDDLYYSPNDKRLFFKLEDTTNATKPLPLTENNIRIWHYQDIYGRLIINRFTTSIAADGGQFVQMETRDSVLVGPPGDDVAIVSTNVNTEELYIDKSQFPIYQLLSLADGSRRSISPATEKIFRMELSPAQKFITWKDTLTQQIYSYEIATQQTRNITSGILYPNLRGLRFPDYFYYAGWLANDTALLLYDQYDIWQVDPRGINKPIPLTNGYGAKHKTILRVAEDSKRLSQLKAGDPLLIAGLVDSNRYNGLYTTILYKSTQPKIVLPPQAAVFYFPSLFIGEPPLPVKAANVYLLQHQSATSSANLILLNAAGKITTLSDIHPERTFNWMTSSLHTWETADGQPRSGILYKPAHFDSTKRYPIIFHYYEVRSNECFRFIIPALSTGALDIPWYVSNGYLVFIPDIWQETGHIGLNATTSVESAAAYLTQHFPWINKHKMGLQGHSFGGYETNFIITHCNIFAAAQSSSGLSDMLREYGDRGFGGRLLSAYCEVGQLNLGHSPWERRNLYIDNSPFLQADKVETPLLLVHGTQDDAVPFQQSLEMFTALRRLHKSVWLLEYTNEDHILSAEETRLDFILRQQQFFNHYLKDSIAPVWMIRNSSIK